MFGYMNFSQNGDMNLIHTFSKTSEENSSEDTQIEVCKSVELVPCSGNLYLGNIEAAKDVLKLKKK